MASESSAAHTESRPRWVDLKMIQDLEALAALVQGAIISVHRINAINTVGGEIRPWTDEQFDWVESEHLVHIGRLARIVTPPEPSRV